MDNVSESTRVRVAVRIRPIGLVDTTARGLKKIVVHAADEHTLIVDDEQKGQRQYKFDNVFLDDQATVFAAIGRPMLHETFKGFNVCLFAYGQTGSGKTYSILGDMTKESSTGLTPRLVHDLFSEAQQLVEKDTDLCIKISMSMTEIYMEKVRDLLAPRTRGHEPETLDIREDAVHRVYVKGISRHPILSYERTIELLKMGNANRQIAETLMNETSSRSHAIIQINVLQEYGSIVKKDLESTITLVDLAGSERQGKTESTEHHFEEAKKINHSLLMLGRALNAFSERKTADAFISLRESKLTRLLSESFGGNSKTWMLATVAPTLYSLGETLSTLDYARNAMAITNVVHVNKCARDMQFKELIRLRNSFNEAVEREVALIKEYDIQNCHACCEIRLLEDELEKLKANEAENELECALNEYKMLVKRLYFQLFSLQKSSEAPLVCFSGTCKTSLATVVVGSYEHLTMIVPVYDLAGPPPMLFCRVFLDHTDDGNIAVIVKVDQVHHLPDFANGGVQVSIWFKGQVASKVTSPIVSAMNNSADIEFQQAFVFGPPDDELRNYLNSHVLYFQVNGIIVQKMSDHI